MFNFFRKAANKNTVSGFTFNTDIHSHILPGIDDGSPDIETSLQLLKGLYELGIRKTVATPHVIGDLYRNTPETINNALQVLQSACKEAQIDIEITAAAEYMLDDYFMQMMNDKVSFLPIHKKIILTEQSYASPTHNLNEISFALITEGYRPIMAHPERYFFYHNDYKQYNRLKDLGFLFQVNLLSLTGYYGKPVTKAAKYIMDNDMAELVGTDMHNLKHLNFLQKKDNLAIFEKYLSYRTFNDLSMF